MESVACRREKRDDERKVSLFYVYYYTTNVPSCERNKKLHLESTGNDTDSIVFNEALWCWELIIAQAD